VKFDFSSGGPSPLFLGFVPKMRQQLKSSGGTTNMLSLDQFLRFVSVPALFAALLVASQVSGAGVFH
jgi:hypothetical protein